jgi:MFS family permease
MAGATIMSIPLHSTRKLVSSAAGNIQAPAGQSAGLPEPVKTTRVPSVPSVPVKEIQLHGVVCLSSTSPKKTIGLVLVPSVIQQKGRAEAEEVKPKHNIEKIHYCFAVIVFITMGVNFDSGAVPAILDTMRSVFNMQPVELGLLGGLQYLGLTIMCPIAGHLLQTYGKRRVLSTCLLLNTVCCLGFALSVWKWMLLLCRVGIGMTQAIFVVYAPVWVDDFAAEGQAATWMAILQASMPLGVMVGYTTAGFLVNAGLSWRWVILIQVMLLTLPTIGSFFVPKKYLEHEYQSKSLLCDQLPLSEQQAAPGKQDSPVSVAEDPFSEIQINGFGEHLHEIKIDRSTENTTKQSKDRRFWHDLLTVLSSSVFVCSTLGLSCLYFVVTGVQFWATEFLLGKRLPGVPGNVRGGIVVQQQTKFAVRAQYAHSDAG